MAIKNRDKWVTWNRPEKKNEIPVRAELLMTKDALPSGKRDYAIIFDQASDVVDALNNNINSPMNGLNGNGSWRTGSMYFNGQWAFGTDKEIQNCVDLNRQLALGTGSTWANGIYDAEVKRLRDEFPALQELKEVGVTNKRRRVWREEGDELDIDRYMNGDVEQWTSVRRAAGVKKTCTIVYESGTSCGTDPNSFVKSMATLAAISDIVEASGISSEIIVAFTSHQYGYDEGDKTIAVKVKNFEEQLDVQRLLSMSSAGFFRCHLFGIIENMAHNDKASSSYGTAMNLKDKKAKFSELWGADVHVQGSDNFNNKDNIEVIIADIAKAVGIEKQRDISEFADDIMH